jgi:hypothetical protein
VLGLAAESTSHEGAIRSQFARSYQNAVREDLQVSHKSVSSWLNALERLYAIFRLSPFGAPRWQISAIGTKDYQTPDGIRVAPAIELLKALI